jgi:hypothetical protein
VEMSTVTLTESRSGRNEIEERVHIGKEGGACYSQQVRNLN